MLGYNDNFVPVFFLSQGRLVLLAKNHLLTGIIFLGKWDNVRKLPEGWNGIVIKRVEKSLEHSTEQFKTQRHIPSDLVNLNVLQRFSHKLGKLLSH